MTATFRRARSGLYIPRGVTWAQAVAADNPFLWWRFGEASGTSAADSSTGGSNTGTYGGGFTLGTTGLITGDSNTAVTFDGTSGRCLKSSAIVGYPSTALTAEIVIKPSSLAHDGALFTRATVDTGFGSAWSFYLYLHSTGALEGAMFSGSTASIATTSTGLVAAGSKYVVALRGDTSSVDLWVNGSQIATASGLVGSLNNAATTAIVVGDWWQNASTHNFYAGVADEALLFASKLSGTRLAAHAAAA